MSEWKDIETAPKDGTDVLVYVPAWTHSKACITTASWHGGDWYLVMTGGYAESADIYPEPTHWQPLPAPPEAP